MKFSDRAVGLEKRADLTGRLIRLMGSTYLGACAEASGKLLFSICSSDRESPYRSMRASNSMLMKAPYLVATTFAAQLGYGNASGFLQNTGQLVPPSALDGSSSTAADQSGTINPITGAVDALIPADEPPMTDAEKEREAERLFVVFERLNKNGAISVENPITAAKQAGKFGSTGKEDEASIREIADDEDEEERLALAELARYKERKAKIAAAGR